MVVFIYMILGFSGFSSLCIFALSLNRLNGFYLKPKSITRQRQSNTQCRNNGLIAHSNNNLYDTDTETATNNLETIRNFQQMFGKTDYNEVIQGIRENEITDLYITPDYSHIISVDNANRGVSLYDNFHKLDINPLLTNKIIDRATDANVHVTVADFSVISEIQHTFGAVLNAIAFAFPFIFVSMIVYSFFSILNKMPSPTNLKSRKGSQSRMSGGMDTGFGGGFGDFLMNDDDFDELYESQKPNVSFASWSGSPEVIEECREIITYLDNKEAYARVGAEMPKGILFEGPPGTGKTLLAKAIATETNSTFISISGSEFVELFVGMGAARVRELFDDARENRPAIIFIDEIDAIGKQRANGPNIGSGGNEEREQTLNQLLYEMDGFNNNDDIIILAATNRKDILDKALLRPGRFDRVIRIPTPDRESRQQILEQYMKNKPFDTKNVKMNISALAELTDGFSGAELKNLVNEAAILAARNNQTTIKQINLFDAFEKSIVGLIRKNATVDPATQKRVAIHELGHALMVLEFPEYFQLQKVSIQPTYDGAGGYTLFSELPEIKEGGLYTKDLFKKRLAIMMGGKAAENLIYGSEFVSMGAIQDLNQANQLAKRMVGNFGMGNELEVFYNVEVGDRDSDMYGGGGGFGNTYSEGVRELMDSESLELVRDAFQMSKTVLAKHREKLDRLSNRLILDKVLYRADLNV